MSENVTKHTKKMYQTTIILKICLIHDLRKSTIKIVGQLEKLNTK